MSILISIPSIPLSALIFLSQYFLICSYYRYTPEEYPVLAFTGAPARFPVEQHHTSHQKYLQWSDNIVSKVDKFIEENIGTEKYLGIHLRLGSDFVSHYYSPS